jgi:hypothetical protein
MLSCFAPFYALPGSAASDIVCSLQGAFGRVLTYNTRGRRGDAIDRKP